MLYMITTMRTVDTAMRYSENVITIATSFLLHDSKVQLLLLFVLLFVLVVAVAVLSLLFGN